LADVPVPLNRRIGATLLDAGGAQAVKASEVRVARAIIRIRCLVFLTAIAHARAVVVNCEREVIIRVRSTYHKDHQTTDHENFLYPQITIKIY
jgi:hypothetical protein